MNQENPEVKMMRHKAGQPMSIKERLFWTAVAAVIGLGTIALLCILDQLFRHHY